MILMDEMLYDINGRNEKTRKLCLGQTHWHIFGFIDLGDTELNYATLQKPEEFTPHVFVFLVPCQVNFARNEQIMQHLFNCSLCFWKQLGSFEENCEVKVVGVTYDVTSPDRRMFRMHSGMTMDEDKNEDVDMTYRTRNVFAKDDESQKSARKCFDNSSAAKCTRSMTGRCFIDDIERGLKCATKNNKWTH